jgi:hypothetical protein
MTVLTTIATSLNIVDKFVALADRFLGRETKSHSVEAKQVGDKLQIVGDGQVAEEITITSLRLNEWDQMRFETLKRRVDEYWKQYNKIYGDLPLSATDEKARLRIEA